MGISIIAAYLKHLFLSKKYRLLKNIALYSTLFLFMISLGAYINYRLDLSYEGTAQIQFIEEKHSNLEEIIQLPQFKGKVVYVDLWCSSCGPCLEEFKYTAFLKNKLAGKNVAFLYLGKETSHPNSKQRWKNAIKEHNLQGWHFYMSNSMAANLWEEIMANQEDKTAPASFPRYLLIDQNGQVITYHAKRPSEQEPTVRQIEAALQLPMTRNTQPDN
jgi:thiol-disulfide isomerase/thioredoxin